MKTLQDEYDDVCAERDMWKKRFTDEHAALCRIGDTLEGKVRDARDASAVERQAIDEIKGNREWVDNLCSDICKMEDALGLRQDQHTRTGKFRPTLDVWLERVRDFIAMEGEYGDLNEFVKGMITVAREFIAKANRCDMKESDALAQCCDIAERMVADGPKNPRKVTPTEKEQIRSLLLTGVQCLVEPDYHRLNQSAQRNDRMLHAVLCAYVYFTADAPSEITCGWLSEQLQSVICNEIGDGGFIRWGETFK